jgi:Glycosyl transferase family 2
MLRLSAIVPATDRPRTLSRCVAAITGADEPPEELIVVEEPQGAGPARARNLGAATASGEVLVFVDSDVVVHADAFSRIRRAFDADPEPDAVFGSYDDAPEAPGPVSGFRNLLHHHVHQSAGGPARTFWAGLGAIRRDVFLGARGFDAERFLVPSIEDVDLGARLVSTGARIELDPSLLGTHLKAWSLAEMIRTDFTRRGIPWVSLLLDDRAPLDVLNLGWRHRLSAAASLVGAAALLRRRPLAAGGAAVALVALNHSFYALLLARRGPLEAAAGVGLHSLHHLTAAAAIPAGLVARRFRSAGVRG